LRNYVALNDIMLPRVLSTVAESLVSFLLLVLILLYCCFHQHQPKNKLEIR